MDSFLVVPGSLCTTEGRFSLSVFTINANIYYPSLSAMTGGFQNLMHSKYFLHFLTKNEDKRNLLNSLNILTNKGIVYIKTLNKVPKICCKCID